MSATKAQVQGYINEHAVVVFSKSYCPYCEATKKLLTELNAKFKTYELDLIDDGAAIQSILAEISGQRTVPNVYINQKHIGGNSDVQGLKGQLPELLKEAGAL